MLGRTSRPSICVFSSVHFRTADEPQAFGHSLLTLSELSRPRRDRTTLIEGEVGRARSSRGGSSHSCRYTRRTQRHSVAPRAAAGVALVHLCSRLLVSGTRFVRQ